MIAPTNHCSIAFAHFSTIHASEPSLAEGAPPKGGLLATNKPMTLASYGYRDKLRGTRGRVLPHCAGRSVVVRGAAAGFAGWLRRRTLAQYSGLVFSILDG